MRTRVLCVALVLASTWASAREAVREFNRRGVIPEVSCAAGKIISMSSVHDIIPWAGHVNYAASKGGLLMFMKSLAQEVAHQKIRVNAISPGAIRTNINRVAWETPEAEAELTEFNVEDGGIVTDGDTLHIPDHGFETGDKVKAGDLLAGDLKQALGFGFR